MNWLEKSAAKKTLIGGLKRKSQKFINDLLGRSVKIEKGKKVKDFKDIGSFSAGADTAAQSTARKQLGLGIAGLAGIAGIAKLLKGSKAGAKGTSKKQLSALLKQHKKKILIGGGSAAGAAGLAALLNKKN